MEVYLEDGNDGIGIKVGDAFLDMESGAVFLWVIQKDHKSILVDMSGDDAITIGSADEVYGHLYNRINSGEYKWLSQNEFKIQIVRK